MSLALPTQRHPLLRKQRACGGVALPILYSFGEKPMLGNIHIPRPVLLGMNLPASICNIGCPRFCSTIKSSILNSRFLGQNILNNPEKLPVTTFIDPSEALSILATHSPPLSNSSPDPHCVAHHSLDLNRDMLWYFLIRLQQYHRRKGRYINTQIISAILASPTQKSKK